MSNPDLLNLIAANPDPQRWRRALHAHPELAFEEQWSSDFVAERLAALDIPFERGIASTGIVASLRKGSAAKAIALRADLDALPVTELNEFAHRSTHPGRMHACGHDGHVAMLLAAAAHLAQSGQFDGTVHFIFQPAEEDKGGASRMIREGLFERFPVSAVYGMHIFPEIPLGSFAVRHGSIMASCDDFEIRVRGRGGHAAMPQQVRDPVIAASHLVIALQSMSIFTRHCPISSQARATAALVVSRSRFSNRWERHGRTQRLPPCCSDPPTDSIRAHHERKATDQDVYPSCSFGRSGNLLYRDHVHRSRRAMAEQIQQPWRCLRLYGAPVGVCSRRVPVLSV